MQTKSIFKYYVKGLLVWTLIISTPIAFAAIVSRVTSFSDGSVLFASQLNSEFNNLISGINSINNDQIASNAAIAPSKLSASIAGDGISRNGTTGAISVSVDDSTIEIDSNNVQLKDAGTTNAKLADMAALTVKANATNASATPQDLAAGTDGYVLARSGTSLAFGQVQTAGLASESVTQEKMAPRSTGTTVAAGGVAISNSSGTFTSISAAFVSVTNLSVTITTTGRPVVMMIQSTGNTDSFVRAFNSSEDTASGSLRFTRDGTATCRFSYNMEANGADEADLFVPSSSFSCVRALAAGTYTFVVQIQLNIGTEVRVNDAQLVVYEL